MSVTYAARNHCMPKIFVLSGPDVGHSYDVQAGAVFGRADECAVRLHDASVSRQHARLEHTAAGWSVVDLNSRNGVFWDGARVLRVSLEEGREFSLGEVVLKFREGAAAKQPVVVKPVMDEAEEIVLEGEWDESRAPTVASPAMTAFTPRAASVEPAQPSIARRQATERLAAAGALPSPSKIGARGVLQYGKVESRAGVMQSDFDQQPFLIKLLILFAVLVVVAGVSWLAFRAVVLTRGSPEPVIEENVDEAR